jgi:hypothetical protein
MVRRVVRVGLWAGLAGAVGVGLLQAARWWREVGAPPLSPSWPPLAESPDATPATAEPAIEPVDGSCPTTHPVKGKSSSGLYHLPGMVAYGRTNADTCFVDADAAEAAGFTRAKR